MTGILSGNIVGNSHYKNLYHIFEGSYDTCEIDKLSLLEIDGNDYTYSDLKKKVGQFSYQFHRIGLKKGDRVGIFIANGLERIATILALAKLGIVFFPLDPILTKEKVAQIISQCPPAMILIGSEHDYPTLWKHYDVLSSNYCLNEIKEFPTKENEHETQEILKEDLFCILFTSGSTGTSKGVMLNHGNFINRLTWYWSAEPYDKNDIPLSKTNVLFIDCMVEVLAPILKCVPCVFMQRHHYQDFGSFLKYLNQYRITRLYLVPSLLKPLTLLSNSNELNLKHVICSGEALPNDLASAFVKKFPSTTLCNYYGTTELPEVLAATFSIEKISSNDNSIIGFPVDNTIVYIVKEDGSLITSDEEEGELWVAGQNVSVGYVNTNKTKEVYIKNPFNEIPKFSRVYKTGDYVKMTTNGIEYLGRRDNFVKIRGHKVCLTDIEHIIKELLPSAQVSVLSKLIETTGQRQIYAFISSDSMSEDELTGLLMDRLPHYMLPRVVLIDKMPLTPSSGKIDRQVLLQNAPKRFTGLYDNNEQLPTSTTEKIRRAVSIVLHIPIERVDESKSFYQLGGDSISSFLLLHNLRELGIDSSLEKILQSRSLREMADGRSSTCGLSVADNMKVVLFSDLSDEEIKVVADHFVETFKLVDPLFQKQKQHGIIQTILGIVFKCKKYFPGYGAAVKIDDHIVAAVVNEPLESDVEEEYPPLPEAMEELFKVCMDETIEKLLSENQSILNSVLLYVDQNIPADVGTQALVLLGQETFNIGKSNGHTASITIDTSVATQLLDLDVRGSTLMKTVYPHNFCYKNTYPFMEMDADYKICTIVEYFH